MPSKPSKAAEVLAMYSELIKYFVPIASHRRNI
jgi:hypothetical protein